MRISTDKRFVVGVAFALLISAVFITTPEVPASTAALQPQLQDVAITVDRVIASGFSLPLQLTHAGDGSGRLFVVEQTGTVRIIKDEAVLPTPFLDISSAVACCGEQGLLGLAFHPNYESNGYFYINYTRKSDGATVIARYTASAADPDRADAATAATLLTIPQPAGNHNGGQVAFGLDGYLYIGMGDGGSAGDPWENAQDPTNLLGAMLRLDVDTDFPYAIPVTNPYVGTAGRDEIWAIGLRNPWRFSFDRATGDLYIGDVGQNQWEEISFAAAGSPGGINFGWDCLEGTHTYEWDTACAAATLTPPIAEYNHTEGRSVTGGFVYRGAQYPDLVGRYFYADYAEGKIWSIYQTDTGFSTPELELDTSLLITAFGEDETGELYVVERNGSIRYLADVNGASPPPDLSGSYKQAATPSADPDEIVPFTIVIDNSGRALPGTVTLTDTLPSGVEYIPGSLSATTGTVDDSQVGFLAWQGIVEAQNTITITYQVRVTGSVLGSLVNHALISGESLETIDLPAAIYVPRNVLTTTLQDLFMPGTQPGALIADIPNSVDCDTCHSAAIYDRWRGTLMSQAARDPLMHAALSTANANAPNAGDYCLRCHVPKAWLEGRSHPADGSAMTMTDIANGVACEVCHRAVDPLPTYSEIASTDTQIRNALTATVPITYVGSGTLVIDPADNRRGPFAFDPVLPYHTAFQTAYLGQDSTTTDESITRARMCGTCHDVDNPILSWDEGLEQYWPNAADTAPEVIKGQLFPIERTYTEWLNSAYPEGVIAPAFAGAQPDDTVSACQDCHMERRTGTAADAAFNPVTRDCATSGCLPEHMMVGGNTWVPELLQNPDWRLSTEPDAAALEVTTHRAASMLSRAATLSISLTTQGPGKSARVRVTNETGHKLPTGYPEGRQMWLNVRAYDAAGNVIYESGAYDATTNTLIRDADIKVYEAKQGISPELAAVLDKPVGPSFHFVLNNVVIKDNRIPPRGYTPSTWDQPGLRPVGATYANGQHWDETSYVVPNAAVRASAILYYQTASQEYITFLRTNGGVDGESLYDLWSENPSPPVVMALASDPPILIYMPIIFKNW